jgi:beta-phosphoglucomutase
MKAFIKAVLFDLDGVLVDTARFHYVAWKELADREGIYFDEQINERLKGVSRSESLAILLEQAGREYSAEEQLAMMTSKNKRYLEWVETLTPGDCLPGVPALLAGLREAKLKTAICSASKSAVLIARKLRIEDCFDVILGGADVTRSKPDPEVFLLAAKRLGIEPGFCLVIEDAYAGIEAAKRAGMRSFGVGEADQLPNADRVFRRPGDITVQDVTGDFSGEATSVLPA